MRNKRIHPPSSRSLNVLTLPLKVNIITNYACNLSCTYCDVAHLNKSMLKTDELLALIDALADMGMQQVHFIGGEPLLRKDFAALLAKSKQRGVTTAVHSNGNFVRPPDTDLISNIDIFITCINGKLETHERSRGRGTYAPTLVAISLMKEHGVTVICDMILNVDNYARDEVRHVLGLARDYGFRINFQPVFEHGLVAADTNLVADLKLQISQLRNVFSYLLEEYDELVMFNSKRYFEDILSAGVTQLDECFMGKYSLTVDPYGRFARCFKYVQNPLNPNGKVLGWKEAAEQVRLTDCTTCPYSSHAEDNYFLDAFFRTI